MSELNVGEKICLYRIKLKHKNFQEFAEAADVPGGWLLDLSKKQKINNVNMDYLLNLCNYLKITINQLMENDDLDLTNMIKSIIKVINYDNDIKMDGHSLNEKAKQVLKDALDISIDLVRQYL